MPNRPKVAILAYDGLSLFEFAIATEIFALPRPECGPDWYKSIICAGEAGPLRAQNGLSVHTEHSLDELDAVDLIIIPGWRAIDAKVPDRLVKALKSAHDNGTRIASICSGVAVLAATGLLNGKTATTHWRYIDYMRNQFSEIKFDESVLYVDNGSILTAAGSAAGIDLCLHIVRQDFGAAIANKVARRLIMSPHREGGQAQFIESPLKSTTAGQPLGPFLQWLEQNIADPHTIRSMARQVTMSERSFQRKFQAMTGKAPTEWIISARIRKARDLLDTTNLPLAAISQTAGFGAVETMRHHFRTHLGMSPSQYRKNFAHRRQSHAD